MSSRCGLAWCKGSRDHGKFYVITAAELTRPGYGPLALVTSGHSEAIADYENTGDAIIAVHGPISASSDAQIGDAGTANSTGCVRLHERDLVQLATVPAGIPIDVVD